MTTTPAQPAQGPYHVVSMPGIECVCCANGPLVAQMFATPRQLQLDSGADWDANAEPYSAYRERIKPELAREAEIRAATARLLAASWDLLACCREFLPILELQLQSINPGGAAEGSRAFQAASERVARMRAAVAKAEAVS